MCGGDSWAVPAFIDTALSSLCTQGEPEVELVVRKTALHFSRSESFNPGAVVGSKPK